MQKHVSQASQNFSKFKLNLEAGFREMMLNCVLSCLPEVTEEDRLWPRWDWREARDCAVPTVLGFTVCGFDGRDSSHHNTQ